MRHLSIYLLILVLFTACKKDELEQVGPNIPPADNTIASVGIENYINRTYILALGREPDSVEFDNAYYVLHSSNVDSASRQIFLNSIFSDVDYYKHLYIENNTVLLNNADTADFTFWITIFTYYLSDTAVMYQWPVLQYELDRMVLMHDAFNQFVAGSIDIDELQRRMCNNYIYDQINMGATNFVNSTFQNLINRNPTIAEQQGGVSMVNGFNATIFLQAGTSKNEYLDIISHSDDYFEAQVILLYRKYLNRIPTTIEMADGTVKYQTSGDYTVVQREILSSNEFTGL